MIQLHFPPTKLRFTSSLRLFTPLLRSTSSFWFFALLLHSTSSPHVCFFALLFRFTSSFHGFATPLLLRSAFFAPLLHFTASICFFAPSLPSDSSLHFLSLLSPACFCERPARIFNISAFSELDTNGTVLSYCGNCEKR